MKCRRNSTAICYLKLSKFGLICIPTCGDHFHLVASECRNIRGEIAVIKIDTTDPLEVWHYENDKVETFYEYTRDMVRDVRKNLLELRSRLNDHFKYDERLNAALETLSKNVELVNLKKSTEPEWEL